MKRFLALMLAMLTLTGCFADKDNIINLLSSPKLSQRESEIVRCITEHLGEDVILKYPKQGRNISPVQTVDLSHNGSQEAVVLYTAPNTGGNVRMAVLSKTEGQWHVDYDAEGYGTEIYNIIFANLDKGQDKHIIVGYTFSDSSEKFLAVYSTSRGKIGDIQYQACQDFMVEDVTGDGISDIILASLNADNKNTQLRLLSTQDNTFLSNVATKQLSVPNARVTNIDISNTDFSDRQAVLVDYTDSYFRVYTQRVYYDENDFTTILKPDVVQKKWDYDYNINSRDVDGDGFMETPTVITDVDPTPENLKFMEWTGFLLNEPVRKYYGFCEAENGLYFPLPDSWQNLVTLAYGEEQDNWQVIRISDGTVLLSFTLLPTGHNQHTDENGTIVNAGTLQIKIVFDESVPKDQRDYIAKGLMYIR